MRFYYSEVTYEENFLVWELKDNGNLAVSVETTDAELKKVTPIVVYNLDKLSHRNDVSISGQQLLLNNLAEFEKKYSYEK